MTWNGQNARCILFFLPFHLTEKFWNSWIKPELRYRRLGICANSTDWKKRRMIFSTPTHADHSNATWREEAYATFKTTHKSLRFQHVELRRRPKIFILLQFEVVENLIIYVSICKIFVMYTQRAFILFLSCTFLYYFICYLQYCFVTSFIVSFDCLPNM